MHLIIDGYGGNRQKMESVAAIYELLDRYPGQIGMHKIAPPYVFRYVGVKPQDWGVTGFVLIAESHISIHTFPERAYVNIDVFSCKEFAAEEVVKDLQGEFSLAQVRTRLLKRGLEYPHRVTEAVGLVEEERRELISAGSR